MATELSRRQLMAAVAASALLPGAAQALTVSEARGLIDKTVADVMSIINSGKSLTSMYADFERLFIRYGDVPVIARSALGAPARTASAAQMAAFTAAFQGYLSRKYGRRFREFIGSKIQVTGAQPLKSYFEVISIVTLRGQAPFEVRWHVSDKSGSLRFFNIIIEGVNMLSAERTEIGAMLDRRGGNIDLLIQDLKST